MIGLRHSRVQNGIFSRFPFGGIIGCLLLASAFYCPSLVFRSVLNGLSTAVNKVIPAVFPLMVVSSVIMDSPLCCVLGTGLLPYTKLLGIRDRSAASVLFLGLLGGFAVLSQGIAQLYSQRRIDRRQAELLLCAGMGTGPAFTVLTVGYGLLRSVRLGFVFLICLYISNLFSALFMRICRSNRTSAFAGMPADGVLEGRRTRFGLAQAMQKTADACLLLCCYIAFFSFLCALTERFFSPEISNIVCSLLEVTNAVVHCAALQGRARIYFALAALSWSGVSIHLQARALLPAEIRLLPFYLSRIPAVLLSLVLCSLALRLMPQVSVPAMAIGNLSVSRFRLSVPISFLMMAGAFLYECTPRSTLLHEENRL